jgi:hypothetical protein
MLCCCGGFVIQCDRKQEKRWAFYPDHLGRSNGRHEIRRHPGRQGIAPSGFAGAFIAAVCWQLPTLEPLRRLAMKDRSMRCSGMKTSICSCFIPAPSNGPFLSRLIRLPVQNYRPPLLIFFLRETLDRPILLIRTADRHHSNNRSLKTSSHTARAMTPKN